MSNLILPGNAAIANGQTVQAVPVMPVGLPARQWNMDVQLYSQATNIPKTRGCFAFMVTNTGADIAMFNGMILYPGVIGTSLGDSRTIAGHMLDMYAGNLTLSFRTVVNPQVEVVQLFYILNG